MLTPQPSSLIYRLPYIYLTAGVQLYEDEHIQQRNTSHVTTEMTSEQNRKYGRQQAHIYVNRCMLQFLVYHIHVFVLDFLHCSLNELYTYFSPCYFYLTFFHQLALHHIIHLAAYLNFHALKALIITISYKETIFCGMVVIVPNLSCSVLPTLFTKLLLVPFLSHHPFDRFFQ